MRAFCLIGAFLVPVLFALYLAKQIKEHKIKDWQIYACLSVVVGFVSFLFLAGSGWLESVSFGSGKVQLMNTKLQEAEEILNRTKEVALAAADAAILANKPLRASSMDTSEQYAAFHSNIVQLLDLADAGQAERERRLKPIEKYLEQLRREESELDHPLYKAPKPTNSTSE